MPTLAIDDDGGLSTPVEAVHGTEPMESVPHGQFRSGVAATNARHIDGPLLSPDAIREYLDLRSASAGRATR